MSLKKYLLAGGLSTVLLLGACGGADEEPAEEEAAPAEETEDTSSEEEVTEDTESAEEETEDVENDTEEENTDEVVEETEAVTDTPDGVETIKAVEPNETIEIENVNVTVTKAQINRVDVDEDLAIFMDDYEEGDKVDNLVIEYTIENTTDAPRDLYIDQSVIVTSTGQQVDPDMFLADNITSSMLGAIEYTGSVPYIMDEGAGDDIEWVDVNVPAVMDGDSYERVADETQFRIEF